MSNTAADLEFTETPNPIGYEWWLDGPQGAKFELHPEIEKHTKEDIARAKAWLRVNHDVVSISVRWKEAGELKTYTITEAI